MLLDIVIGVDELGMVAVVDVDVVILGIVIGSLGFVQLLMQIRCFETTGIASCLCMRLLIALNEPP